MNSRHKLLSKKIHNLRTNINFYEYCRTKQNYNKCIIVSTVLKILLHERKKLQQINDIERLIQMKAKITNKDGTHSETYEVGKFLADAEADGLGD